MDVGTGIPLGHVFQRGWTAGRLLCPFATAAAIDLRVAPACVPDTSQTLSSFRQGSIRRPTRFNPESVELQLGCIRAWLKTVRKPKQREGLDPRKSQADFKQPPVLAWLQSLSRFTPESVELQLGCIRPWLRTVRKPKQKRGLDPRKSQGGFERASVLAWLQSPSRFTPESVELQAGMHTPMVENCAKTQAKRGARSK